LFILQQAVVRIRFFLPIVPVLIIGASYVLSALSRSHFYKTIAVLIVLILVVPIGRSMAEAKHFWYDSQSFATRTAAGRWINANVPAGDSIAVNRIPVSFFCPPFRFSEYRIMIAPDLARLPFDELPDLLIYNSIHDITGEFKYTHLYRQVKMFKNEVGLNKIPLFGKRLYQHVNPVITIYKKRSL
jgi:hypothetical protein